jgi:hypothetical protein
MALRCVRAMFGDITLGELGALIRAGTVVL